MSSTFDFLVSKDYIDYLNKALCTENKIQNFP